MNDISELAAMMQLTQGNDSLSQLAQLVGLSNDSREQGRADLGLSQQQQNFLNQQSNADRSFTQAQGQNEIENAFREEQVLFQLQEQLNREEALKTQQELQRDTLTDSTRIRDNANLISLLMARTQAGEYDLSGLNLDGRKSSVPQGAPELTQEELAEALEWFEKSQRMNQAVGGGLLNSATGQ
tara:strand:- start:22034 stop:22585 length:552 start_codon:yes stop_codon:yes gene_type:complete